MVVGSNSQCSTCLLRLRSGTPVMQAASYPRAGMLAKLSRASSAAEFVACAASCSEHRHSMLRRGRIEHGSFPSTPLLAQPGHA